MLGEYSGSWFGQNKYRLGRRGEKFPHKIRSIDVRFNFMMLSARLKNLSPRYLHFTAAWLKNNFSCDVFEL